jgi:DNA-binding transcriptional LysR family regulator
VTLDDLRVFVATCEAGSLSAVARQVGTSQPAVSQHIRRLERELDVTLFERGRRGVTPTAAARVLLASATGALGALDAGRRELDRLRTGDAGTLRLATGGTTLRHFMVRPLARLRGRHPGITFEYASATSTGQCLDALRADRADLAFVTIGATAGGELDQRPVVRTPWVLVASAEGLAPGARREAPVAPDELRSVRAIGVPAHSSSRHQLDEQLAVRGVRLDYSAIVDDPDTAVMLAELGVGQTVLPALWAHDLERHGTLWARPVDGLDPVTFGWAARRWDALPPSAHTFVSLVAEGLALLEAAARVDLVGDAGDRP